MVNEPIVPELLQEEATVSQIVQEAMALLTEPSRRETMRQGYQRVRDGLGEVGVRDRAAQAILSLIKS